MILILAGLAAHQPIAAGPSIRVERLDGDDYRVSVTLEGQPDVRTVGALVLEASERTCGERFVHYGRYQFEVNEPVPGQSADLPTTFLFEQTITCADEPEAEPPQPAPSDLTDAEMAALEPVVLELSTRFFSALDAGRSAETYALADEALHGGQSLEEWTAAQGEPEPALRRDLLRVTWYQNPAGVAAGLYGAVDYSARHASEQRCGYLIWYRARPEDGFLLTRIDETHIADSLDDATRTQIRRLHCRDG